MAVREKGLAKDQLSSPSLRGGVKMGHERESHKMMTVMTFRTLFSYILGEYALLSWEESKSEMWKNFDLVVDCEKQQGRQQFHTVVKKFECSSNSTVRKQALVP